MKLFVPALAALTLAGVSANGQTPRTLPFAGSTWGYFYYERGGFMPFLGLGDQSDNVAAPSSGLGWGLPEGVITIVTRDGAPIDRSDREDAIRVAREICQRNGRVFNSASRGSVLRNGGLSFDGDCTR